jgi:hypothetical protein
MDPDHVKHLELIQAVIARLAGNSFTLKGWSVTLVSALFALAAKDADPTYAAVALLPGTVFWGLDAYFLRQERLFRALYDLVREPPATGVPQFAMDTSLVGPKRVDGWLQTACSGTMLAFHLPLVVAAAAVAARALCH